MGVLFEPPFFNFGPGNLTLNRTNLTTTIAPVWAQILPSFFQAFDYLLPFLVHGSYKYLHHLFHPPQQLSTLGHHRPFPILSISLLSTTLHNALFKAVPNSFTS
jgi:hypothetical protein